MIFLTVLNWRLVGAVKMYSLSPRSNLAVASKERLHQHEVQLRVDVHTLLQRHIPRSKIVAALKKNAVQKCVPKNHIQAAVANEGIGFQFLSQSGRPLQNLSPIVAGNLGYLIVVRRHNVSTDETALLGFSDGVGNQRNAADLADVLPRNSLASPSGGRNPEDLLRTSHLSLWKSSFASRKILP